MSLQPYRRVLAVPRVRTSMLLMFVARLPMTAMGILLTLHTVGTLGRGYGAAGLLGTMVMVGSALAAPTLGRMIDRYGLRPVVAVCGTCSAAFWVSVPHLPYPALALIALPAGMFAVPVGSLSRQVLSALVPQDRLRAAFSLDSIGVEASFMIGPAAGVLLLTQYSSSTALTGIGLCFALTSTALFVLNPPVRGAGEPVRNRKDVRPPLRSWLHGRLIGTLLIATGALFTLIGTEIAVLAALRENGEVAWTGVVIALMAVASIAGGLVHGAVRRSLPQGKLMALMALLVLPVGLFADPWWLLALALVPMNLLCTPTLASTTESVSRLAPARVRGEAMGMQDAATRIGFALGSPAVGLAIDHSSPGWGFVAAGLGGLALASVGFLWNRRAAAAAPVPDLAGAG
ncbi:MFS transporter [Streptomyces sp. ACA25]|uniref:MFS transporter n=1 Tax=Streptomyces sp. ACA25 TaxID=3022596 RepID=UPI00230723C8|nr:MFS transporter [Streptomyces sp. ACA25]MDB1088315.1 MFS transporter [Streptomyces sp. ACA25]